MTHDCRHHSKTRQDNYLLLQRVFSTTLYFSQDVAVLWVIGTLFNKPAIAWYIIIKARIAFRHNNQKHLEQIIKNTLFTPFEWCYILQANPKLLPIVTSYTESIPPIAGLRGGLMQCCKCTTVTRLMSRSFRSERVLHQSNQSDIDRLYLLGTWGDEDEARTDSFFWFFVGVFRLSVHH